MIRIRPSVFLLAFVAAVCATPPQSAQAHPEETVKAKSICLLPEWEVDQLYDTTTVTTVVGRIEAVVEIPLPARGKVKAARDIHLTLNSQKGMFEIHVGPEWFFHKQGLHCRLGDTIEVVGSLMAQCGKSVIVAGRVRIGGKSGEFREPDGAPIWERKKRGK